ncbi:MAG: hypothetical protein JNM84_25895 [Planctomycetes bacterium]|nr:hypothetical protein [Planctomycetota bacterium]
MGILACLWFGLLDDRASASAVGNSLAQPRSVDRGAMVEANNVVERGLPESPPPSSTSVADPGLLNGGKTDGAEEEPELTEESWRVSLASQLIHQQLTAIGKPFDGKLYRLHRSRVAGSDVDRAEKDPILNPGRKVLSEAAKTELRDKLERNAKELRSRDVAIKKLENRLAQELIESGEVAPRSAKEEGRPRSTPGDLKFLETLSDISGPWGGASFRFSYGVIPERDRLLLQQSVRLGDLELDLITWFGSQ